MKAVEVRDAMWAEVRDQVQGLRYEVWDWLLRNGPKTSEEVAWDLDVSLLTVRPRMTELYQLGFVVCVGRRNRSGVYAARTSSEARAAWEAATEAERDPQLPLLFE